MKKGPQNPISLVNGKAAVGGKPGHDRSFNHHNALPAGRHARTRLLAGRGRCYDGGACPRGTRYRVPFAVPARRLAFPKGRPLLAGRVPARTGAWRRAGCQDRSAPGRADLAGRAEWRVDACGPGRQASPPRRPAAGPAAATPGNGGAAQEVTARDPAPAPAGLPPPAGAGRPPAPAPPGRPARAAPLLSPFPAAAPGGRLPPPARRGPDLTRRAERSRQRCILHPSGPAIPISIEYAA